MSRPRDVEESRLRILDLTARLKQYVIGREEVIDMMALALTAAEPMLLLGPPGTAKTELIYKMSAAIGLRSDDYFEYMINAFTEPSEILGPVNIKALREEGVYKRKLEGKLADAAVVFLDEIFNGNSAILNTLLTVMNEHKIYDAGKPLKLEKLVGFFAATNQIPERDELAALKDRFVIKVEVPAVQQALFDDLIDAGMRNELNKADGTTPWVIPGTIAVSDFGNVRQFLTDTLRRRNDEAPETAKLPPEVHRAYRRLVSDLGAHGVVLSDREVIRLYRLIMLHGYLFHGRMPDTVQLSDLGVMRYVAESEDQFEVVRKCVDDAIGAER